MKRNNLFMHISETFSRETSSAPFFLLCLGKKAPWVQVVSYSLSENAQLTTAGTTDRRGGSPYFFFTLWVDQIYFWVARCSPNHCKLLPCAPYIVPASYEYAIHGGEEIGSKILDLLDLSIFLFLSGFIFRRCIKTRD